nr:hypothetical protein [Tanacetum cinerariifolium]
MSSSDSAVTYTSISSEDVPFWYVAKSDPDLEEYEDDESEDGLDEENQEKDKIESKPEKNGKRVESKKSLKQLQ